MQRYILILLTLILSATILYAKTDEKSGQQVIILFGPPASGKGTQAVRLAKAIHLPHISTGDLFRENISKNTPLGQKAKSYIDKGQLVPDELVLDLLFDRLKQSDAAKGYILDGVPRTISQAEALEKHLPKDASVIVLNLTASDDTIVKRALGRKRGDDTPEVIKERLKAYYAQTAPLIGYYKQKGILFDIDGEMGEEEVFNSLLKVLKKYTSANKTATDYFPRHQ